MRARMELALLYGVPVACATYLMVIGPCSSASRTASLRGDGMGALSLLAAIASQPGRAR